MPHKLADVIERKIHNGEARIDIWDLSYRTAVESLGCAGLGYPFHSLDESKSKSDAYSNAVKSFLWAFHNNCATDVYIAPVALPLSNLVLFWHSFRSLRK